MKLRKPDRVYGPYLRKDGRKHVILIYADGSRRTVSYPKWLNEKRLGRELDPNLETTHHKDQNVNNNRHSNLEIKSRAEHSRQHALESPAETVRVRCKQCGHKFTKRACLERRRKKRGMDGPFCNKACLGTWTRAQQLAAGRTNLRRR